MWNFVSGDKAQFALSLETKFYIQKCNTCRDTDIKSRRIIFAKFSNITTRRHPSVAYNVASKYTAIAVACSWRRRPQVSPITACARHGGQGGQQEEEEAATTAKKYQRNPWCGWQRRSEAGDGGDGGDAMPGWDSNLPVAGRTSSSQQSCRVEGRRTRRGTARRGCCQFDKAGSRSRAADAPTHGAGGSPQAACVHRRGHASAEGERR